MASHLSGPVPLLYAAEPLATALESPSHVTKHFSALFLAQW